MSDTSDTKPVVLITGGAKRIGAEIARRFHSEGCHVIIHHHQSANEATALATELDGHALQANLTNPQDIADLAIASMECFGRLDFLINNASTFYPTPIAKASNEAWDALIDSNLRGAYFLSQALASEIANQGGAIVNIIDAMAERGMANFSLYNIAKAGLTAMTRSLARELAPAVRVNAVSPGAILWPTQLEDSNDPAVASEQERILKQIALGRLGTPADIANAVYFLAREATYVTGMELKVDGGRSLS